jgi:hypothetical protein
MMAKTFFQDDLAEALVYLSILLKTFSISYLDSIQLILLMPFGQPNIFHGIPHTNF